MLRSIGFIPCGFEEVVAFFILEEVADVSDGLLELVIASGGRLSDQRLELGESNLDWIEIGGIWWQEQEPRTDVLQDRGGFCATTGCRE